MEGNNGKREAMEGRKYKVGTAQGRTEERGGREWDNALYQLGV
jgi:hypothetical protein